MWSGAAPGCLVRGGKNATMLRHCVRRSDFFEFQPQKKNLWKKVNEVRVDLSSSTTYMNDLWADKGGERKRIGSPSPPPPPPPPRLDVTSFYKTGTPHTFQHKRAFNIITCSVVGALLFVFISIDKMTCNKCTFYIVAGVLVCPLKHIYSH